jgi:predicted nucleotide-binding protein
MAQKKQTIKDVLSPPNLTESREEVRKKLQERIEKGKTLRDQHFNSQHELDEATNIKKKWSEFNLEMFKRLFDNSAIAKEYEEAGSLSFAFIGGEYSFKDEVQDFRDSIGKKIIKLESILERLDLIPEIMPNLPKQLVTPHSKTVTNDIFIVHGQEEGSKETIARFLSKLDLNPIILHEQPNEGKTIIEKFESHASSVSFAVILMTPDDIGYIKDQPEQAKPRARQNVIFELGYFIGKLSRKNVCALYKDGVEIPSDYQGVLFIRMDAEGIWKFQLAKELKSSGLAIDLNKL